MRNLIFLFITLLSIASCKKDTIQPIDDITYEVMSLDTMAALKKTVFKHEVATHLREIGATVTNTVVKVVEQDTLTMYSVQLESWSECHAALNIYISPSREPIYIMSDVCLQDGLVYIYSYDILTDNILADQWVWPTNTTSGKKKCKEKHSDFEGCFKCGWAEITNDGAGIIAAALFPAAVVGAITLHCISSKSE
jgi:hypothetical protein